MSELNPTVRVPPRLGAVCANPSPKPKSRRNMRRIARINVIFRFIFFSFLIELSLQRGCNIAEPCDVGGHAD
jgi:hypothetical protein